jgi:hypothetical protein
MPFSTLHWLVRAKATVARHCVLFSILKRIVLEMRGQTAQSPSIVAVSKMGEQPLILAMIRIKLRRIDA